MAIGATTGFVGSSSFIMLALAVGGAIEQSVPFVKILLGDENPPPPRQLKATFKDYLFMGGIIVGTTVVSGVVGHGIHRGGQYILQQFRRKRK